MIPRSSVLDSSKDLAQFKKIGSWKLKISLRITYPFIRNEAPVTIQVIWVVIRIIHRSERFVWFQKKRCPLRRTSLIDCNDMYATIHVANCQHVLLLITYWSLYISLPLHEINNQQLHVVKKVKFYGNTGLFVSELRLRCLINFFSGEWIALLIQTVVTKRSI